MWPGETHVGLTAPQEDAWGADLAATQGPGLCAEEALLALQGARCTFGRSQRIVLMLQAMISALIHDP